MSSKYNIGDHVIHTGGSGIETRGTITEKMLSMGKLPPGWQPTANNYVPPVTPMEWLYKIDTIPVIFLFTETIRIDEVYYRVENRNSKLKELGINE